MTTPTVIKVPATFSDMDERAVYDRRRARLRDVLRERGMTQSELSRMTRKSPALISDIFHGRKSFGERLARDFEEELSLAPGYLDGEKVMAEFARRVHRAEGRNAPGEPATVDAYQDMNTPAGRSVGAPIHPEPTMDPDLLQEVAELVAIFATLPPATRVFIRRILDAQRTPEPDAPASRPGTTHIRR
jgi:transcriptional regulator with XRE-family HTH domain